MITGGGASDIRVNGQSLDERLIVAGGGGAASHNGESNGGSGGGRIGGTSPRNAGQDGKGGTQTKGGAAGTPNKNSPLFFFDGTYGYGGNVNCNCIGALNSSGGSGWFGGGAGAFQYGAGTGGSGFVLNSTSTLPTGYKLSSAFNLYQADTINGDKAKKNPSSTGNGYIRITPIRYYPINNKRKTEFIKFLQLSLVGISIRK